MSVLTYRALLHWKSARYILCSPCVHDSANAFRPACARHAEAQDTEKQKTSPEPHQRRVCLNGHQARPTPSRSSATSQHASRRLRSCRMSMVAALRVR